MCPRAHGGAAMVRATTTSAAAASAHSSFAEEEYIDLDLSSCGEYEFRVCRSKPAPPCAEELPGRSRQYKVAPRAGGKLMDADAGAGGGCGRRSTATVAPLHATGHRIAPPECSGRRRRPCKAMQASRAFFRSLFARTSCSDERCRGGVGLRSGSRATRDDGLGVSAKSPFGGKIKNGYVSSSPARTTLRSSIELEKMMDEEEHAASVRQRKSFSGVIKWRPTAVLPASSRNQTVSSARRKSCGSAPALKRSSSCRSESEGMIQGAIAYCKRSQHQQQRVMLARKSVSDAALCPSFRASSS